MFAKSFKDEKCYVSADYYDHDRYALSAVCRMSKSFSSFPFECKGPALWRAEEKYVRKRGKWVSCCWLVPVPCWALCTVVISWTLSPNDARGSLCQPSRVEFGGSVHWAACGPCSWLSGVDQQVMLSEALKNLGALNLLFQWCWEALRSRILKTSVSIMVLYLRDEGILHISLSDGEAFQQGAILAM